MLRHAASLLTLAVAGCAWQGPSLEGHDGLQYRVISFYDAHASERQASCPNPKMQSITASRVVEDTPDKVVMDIRYYWVDWSQATDVAGRQHHHLPRLGRADLHLRQRQRRQPPAQSMTGPQKRA